MEISEGHRFPRSWVGEHFTGSSPLLDDFLWRKEAFVDEPQQPHLRHHRRYPIHSSYDTSKAQARTREEGTTEGGGAEQPQTATHLPGKYLKFDSLSSLSQLQHIAMKGENKVRELEIRGLFMWRRLGK